MSNGPAEHSPSPDEGDGWGSFNGPDGGTALMAPRTLGDAVLKLSIGKRQTELPALVDSIVRPIVESPHNTPSYLAQCVTHLERAGQEHAASSLRAKALSKLTPDERLNPPQALTLSQIEVYGERVAAFLEASGSPIGNLERRLGERLTPLWLGLYDPLVTLEYRQIVLDQAYLEKHLMPPDYTTSRFFQENLTPPLQAYDQPYGLDRYYTAPESLKAIVNPHLGDHGKYETHQFTRYGKITDAVVIRLRQFERLE